MATLAFIGAGSMGGSIAEGLIKSGSFEASQLMVSHAREPYRARLLEAGVRCFADNLEMLSFAPDVVVLAVKPQVLLPLVEEIKELLANKLVISIAAGITLETLEVALPKSRLVRAMPNLPIACGKGAVALCATDGVSAQDKELAEAIFAPLAATAFMREDQLDTEGAAIGCLPAYVALFVDALCRASVRQGMSADVARKMILTTLSGTAEQLLQEGEHPRAYMERVTSPGGTTACALDAMEPGLVAALSAGVDAALSRTAELAQKEA